MGLLDQIRAYLGPPAAGIRLPSAARWSLEHDSGVPVVLAELDRSVLCQNLQTDAAAVPTFAFCLAYWLERASGEPARCQVHVTGGPPDERSLPHWRRSQILIQEYSALLGDRFRVDGVSAWTWPTAAMLNAPAVVRPADSDHDPRSEHALEVQLYQSNALAAAFSQAVEPIKPLDRQLPVGLFDGDVSERARLTPAKSSQVDLWTTSPDGTAFHVFELKAEGNKKLGIVPEAFYYGRLLHYVRAGLPNGTRIESTSPGVAAARAARQIVTWLIAPDLHPLVYSEVRGESPLEWINVATEVQGLSFRILPFELDRDATIHWRPDRRWPRAAS